MSDCEYNESSSHSKLVDEETQRPNKSVKQRKLTKRDLTLPYNDVFFAALFIFQSFLVLSLAVTLGLDALRFVAPNTILVRNDASQSQDSSAQFDSSAIFLGGIALVMFFGSALSIGWLFLLTRLTYRMIAFTFALLLFLATFSFFVATVSGAPLMALALLSLVIFVGSLYFYMRSRMMFAATTLKIACRSIEAVPLTIMYAAAILFVELVFFFVWTIAAIGDTTNEGLPSISSQGHTFSLKQCSTYIYSTGIDVGGSSLVCNKGGPACTSCVCADNFVMFDHTCFTPKLYGGAYFLLLLSLFWVCSTLSNIVHCTTAGAVAAWWTTPESMAPSKDVVQASFLRAVTSSFGSIALGSLLVAFLKTLRAVLNFSLDKMLWIERQWGHDSASGNSNGSTGPTIWNSNPVVAFIVRIGLWLQASLIRGLEIFIGALDKIMAYFNRYAFCYVAIYGLSFFEASKSVVLMMYRRGLSVIINDDIIEVILSLGHTVIAIICTLIGYAYADYHHMGTVNRSLLVITAFWVGYFMCAVMTRVISSAVATIYVCFAESPDDFQSAHPAYYEELALAWKALYPGYPVGGASGPDLGMGVGVIGSYLPPDQLGQLSSLGRGSGAGMRYASLSHFDEDREGRGGIEDDTDGASTTSPRRLDAWWDSAFSMFSITDTNERGVGASGTSPYGPTGSTSKASPKPSIPRGIVSSSFPSSSSSLSSAHPSSQFIPGDIASKTRDAIASILTPTAQSHAPPAAAFSSVLSDSDEGTDSHPPHSENDPGLAYGVSGGSGGLSRGGASDGGLYGRLLQDQEEEVIVQL